MYFLLFGLVMAISGAFTDSYHGEIGGLTIATTEVKDFNSFKMFYHEYEVAIENSNSCDELHVIYSEIWYCNNFYVGGERAFFNDVYRKMTESEKSEIDKIVKGLFYKTEVKRASLGCGEEIYDIDMFQ